MPPWWLNTTMALSNAGLDDPLAEWLNAVETTKSTKAPGYWSGEEIHLTTMTPALTECPNSYPAWHSSIHPEDTWKYVSKRQVGKISGPDFKPGTAWSSQWQTDTRWKFPLMTECCIAKVWTNALKEAAIRTMQKWLKSFYCGRTELCPGPDPDIPTDGVDSSDISGG